MTRNGLYVIFKADTFSGDIDFIIIFKQYLEEYVRK